MAFDEQSQQRQFEVVRDRRHMVSAVRHRERNGLRPRALERGHEKVDDARVAHQHGTGLLASGGQGAHGERIYDWARVAIRPCWEDGFGHWVLARRSISDPTEIAYYVCYGPATSRLKDLAKVAAARWAVEECFQTAKGECGLDHYQVRLYRAWYRHITLAMAALAYLTATRSEVGSQR
ncbi:hypothetical protein QFZ74_005125 [Streptomyces sp. V3I7]|nr:hypothetical protein [Streptomyces sp. V3I7]